MADLFAAGMKTTALSLAYMIVLLIKHEDVQKKAAEEIVLV